MSTPERIAQKRAKFRNLHRQGCFLLPNPWDLGSARLLESMGFSALASTSSGFAWTQGKADYDVTLEELLGHLASLSHGVGLPINADFESGFANQPEQVMRNVGRAIEAGISGLSIEDRVVGDLEKLHDVRFAAERIRAAKMAIDQSGEDVILVARTEGMLVGESASAAIDKLVALADAGADCLFAPGMGMGASTQDDIVALVKAVAPKPVNVLVNGPGMTLAQYEDLGVRRVSIGGALSRVAKAAAERCAERLKLGEFDGFAV